MRVEPVFILLPLALIGLLTSCRTDSTSGPAPPGGGDVKTLSPGAELLKRSDLEGEHGGRLVVTQRAGPKSFNPLFADDQETLTLVECMTARLFRINRQTQETEPELVESYNLSDDRRSATLNLRRGLRFSDGGPFTADDVIFTFRVAYDPSLRSAVTDILTVGGRPIGYERVSDFSVKLTFAEPFAAWQRLFDGVAILPRHKLEPLWVQGRFQSAWNLSASAEEIAGLGPFTLKQYVPGEKSVLVRNPHYWKVDGKGRPLPYLDEIDFLIVPHRSTELLRFGQGEIDALGPLSAEDAKQLEPEKHRDEFLVHNLGPSLITELMWFNLRPGTSPATGRPYVDAVKRAWFQEVRFRRAVSLAIDRAAIASVAFGGSATPIVGPVTPGDKKWCRNPAGMSAQDLARANALLDEIGLRDRDGDGIREDGQGRPVSFTLITNSESEARNRTGLVIQSDLEKAGIRLRLVPLESTSLLHKISETFDYEAGLFSIALGDTDPSAQMSILPSRGAMHWWHPSQEKPATVWEARIDELMTRQEGSLDQAERKRLFDEVQDIMVEQSPFVYLVARDFILVARTDVGNLKPSILPHAYLWNSDELYRRRR